MDKKAPRNLQAREMKQRSKRFAHRNDRRNKDAKRSWKRDRLQRQIEHLRSHNEPSVDAIDDNVERWSAIARKEDP